MAYSLQDTTELTALGDAVRAKTGQSGNMTVAEMATAIAGLSGGGASGDIQVERWNTSYSVRNSIYYKSISKGGTFSVSSSNLPSTFYIGYMPAYNSSPPPSPGQTYYIYKYENNTITPVFPPGGFAALYPETVTQSNGNTTIKFRCASNASGAWALYGGYGNQYYLEAFYMQED